MRTQLRSLLCSLCLLLPIQLYAQATIIRDIRPGTESSLPTLTNGSRLGSRVVFGADNGVTGNEPWVSDGTEAGTTLLRDITTGGATASSNPYGFFNLRGFVYFYTRPTTGTAELWRTDGTSTGTIRVGGDETVNGLFFEIDTTLYCDTRDGLIIKYTDKPGFRPAFNTPFTTGFSGVVGRLGTNWLFKTFVSRVGRVGLFAGDGTLAGTRTLKTEQDGSLGNVFLTGNQRQAFFPSTDPAFGGELWVTDGTVAGTRIVKDILPGSQSAMPFFNGRFPEMRSLQNGVLFLANDGVNGEELWISDGTEAGTRLFREFTPGAAGTSIRFVDGLGTDLVYFTVDSVLWRSDGTDAGTYALSVRTPRVGGGLTAFDVGAGVTPWPRLGNDIYYFDLDQRLHRLNGRPNSDQILLRVENRFGGFAVVPGTLFYAGRSTATGTELWRANFCDHTAAISAPLGASFCAGSSIELEASGPGATGPLTYRWTSGTTNLGTNSKLTVNQAGTYRVEVTDSRGCTVSDTIRAEANRLRVVIGGPTSFCPGESVVLSSTLAAVGGVPPYTYSWSSNSSAFASATTSSTVAVNQGGTYRLFVGDSRSCSGSAEVFVSARSAPTLSVSTSGSTVVPSGTSLSVVLSTPALSNQTYQWLRDGQAISGATSATLLATTPGGYSVRANNGCSATSPLTRLSVGLSVTLSGRLSFCEDGDLTLLTATASNGQPPYSYQWRTGTTTVSTSNTAIVDIGGSFTITATDSRGVVGSPFVFEVTQLPRPNVVISASGSLTLQTGRSVVLSTTAGGNFYFWELNGQVITGASTNSFTATQPGDYRVFMADNNFCGTLSAPVRVTVISTMQVSVSGSNQFCAGSSTVLTATPTGGTAPFTYAWRLGTTTVSMGSSATVSSAGTYTVTMTDSRSLVGTNTVTVTERAAPTAIITANGPSQLAPGTSVVLSASVAAGQTYQWLRDGQPIGGATASSFTATQAGSYAVVVSAGGCLATSAASVISIILATEPAAVGFSLEVSPNPTSHLLRALLTLDDPAPATLRLFDAAGRQVRMHTATSAQRTHEHRFDVGNVPSGVLYLRAEVAGKQLTQKVVKE